METSPVISHPTAPAQSLPKLGGPPWWRQPRAYLGVFALGLGVWLVVYLIRELGAETVGKHVRALASTLPSLFALELGRFVAEMIATRLVIGPMSETNVPLLKLLRGQSLAHACNKVMPAGRAIGEGFKAAILAPAIGTPAAVGVGAAIQIMTILVNGGFALAAGLAAATVLDAPREAGVMGAYGLLSVVVGIGVIISLRSPWLGTLLGRFKPTASLLGPFKEAVTLGTGFGLGALFWSAVSKLAQVGQLAVLLEASGVTDALGARSFFAEGVQVVGAAAGDLVPAQVGATEGAFTLLADALGVSAQSALSVAVVLHGAQIAFAVASFVAAVILRGVEAGLTHTNAPSTAKQALVGNETIATTVGADIADDGE